MPVTLLRRHAILAAAALLLTLPLAASAARAARTQLTAEQRADDFDRMWSFVRDAYCFFPEKTTDWNAVRERYRPLAVSADDDRAFVAVLEAALDELYDAHTHLGVNLGSSYRLPPFDIAAEMRGGRAFVVDVRRDSPAARAGLAPGTEILTVDGAPVAEAVAARRPRCLRRPDAAADEWALLSVLSGRHDRGRDLTVRNPGGLGAGIARTTLPHSGFGVQVSAEPVYHVSGRLHSSFRPRVRVVPTAGAADPYLDAALRRFERARR